MHKRKLHELSSQPKSTQTDDKSTPSNNNTTNQNNLSSTPLSTPYTSEPYRDQMLGNALRDVLQKHIREEKQSKLPFFSNAKAAAYLNILSAADTALTQKIIALAILTDTDTSLAKGVATLFANSNIELAKSALTEDLSDTVAALEMDEKEIFDAVEFVKQLVAFPERDQEAELRKIFFDWDCDFEVASHSPRK